MDKFVPVEKHSKKEQRKYHAQKQGSWGGINPVTRKPPNSCAYHRKTAGSWKKIFRSPFLFYIF